MLACPSRSITLLLLSSLAFALASRPAMGDEPAAGAKPAKKAAKTAISAELQAEIKQAEQKFKDLVPPQKADVEKLVTFLNELKLNAPRSKGEYVVLNRKVRATTRALMKQIKDKKSTEFAEARADYLEASVGIAMALDAKEQAALLDEVLTYVKAQKKVERAEASMAYQLARGLQKAGARKLALKAYDEFSRLFRDSGRRDLESIFRGAAAQMKLPGNKIEVSGTTFEGKEFTIESLKGKVVLIDFWATWCGPCVREHPNILRLYKQYKEKGFEVVGISLDQNRQSLQKYLDEKEVPWITLHDPIRRQRHPVVVKYGISAIPAMFLVGRDGKVVSLKARGEELARLLKVHLGD